MAHDLDPLKLSSPRIFLVRMMVFLVLCALVVVILYKQIAVAYASNVLLNSVIIFVLAVGILLTFRQVIRLFPEVDWVNGFRLADPGLAIERPPVLLAPMASILGDRMGRMAISSTTMRGILDFDRHPPRRSARHLPLYDGSAGLPRPARHVLGPDRHGRLGRQRHQYPQGRRRRAIHLRFAARGPGGAAQRHGHLVFLVAVRPGRLAGAGFPRSAVQPAQNRFYIDLEDWLSTTVRDLGAGTETEPPRARCPTTCGGDRPAEGSHRRRRLEPSGDHRHGQSGGGDPGSGPPHAHRAADDPRTGSIRRPSSIARSAVSWRSWCARTSTASSRQNRETTWPLPAAAATAA